MSAMKWTFQYNAYHGSLNHYELEAGDKIVVHASLLSTLMKTFSEQSLPQPLVFKIENVKENIQTHVGVLEFSSPIPSYAYLPEWLMQHLMLQNGQQIRLTLAQLPLGTHIKFKPQSSDFALIPTPRYTLENALHKFTSLTENAMICIAHGSKKYWLTVTSVEPKFVIPYAVIIVNTQLEVEFESMEINESEKKSEGVVVDIGEDISGDLNTNDTAYYRIKWKHDTSKSLRLRLESTPTALPSSTTGISLPDIYISTTTAHPSIHDSDWKSSLLSKRTVVISPDDTALESKTWLYIAVFAYGAPIKYRVIVEDIESTNTTVISNSSATTDVGIGDDRKLCNNCRTLIPTRQFTLHTVHCDRNFKLCEQCSVKIAKEDFANHIHCPECDIALHRAELSKHHQLYHTTTVCECGKEIDPSQLTEHKRHTCPLRLETCKYCQMQLPSQDLADHTTYCGSRTIECEICQAPISQKKMTIHLAASHGINPSLRPEMRNNMGRPLRTPDSDLRSRQLLERAGFQPTPLDATEASFIDVNPEEDPELYTAFLESKRMHEMEKLKWDIPSTESKADSIENKVEAADDEDDFGNYYSDNDPVYDDDSLMDAQEDHGGDWSDNDANVDVTSPVANNREVETCPYCATSLDNYDKLVDHMAEYHAIDD